MFRLVLAMAIAAPLLGGCVIITTEKATTSTRVVQTPPADSE